MVTGRHPETALFLSACALALVAAALGVSAGPAALIGAAGLAAAAGVPHGALDPLAARQAGLVRTPVQLAIFLAGYTGLALAVIAAWLAEPALALTGFLIISAWHFGGDWFQARPAARWIAGISLLSLPAALHGAEVARIYAILSDEPARTIATVQTTLAPLWIAGLAGCTIAAAARSRRAGLEVAAAGAAALALHPLIFFALYFALLHSARHFLALWRGAREPGAFVRTALFYSTVSLAGAGAAIALLLRDGAPEAAVLQVIFIGLAALTLPHMALIEWMRRRPARLPPV